MPFFNTTYSSHKRYAEDYTLDYKKQCTEENQSLSTHVSDIETNVIQQRVITVLNAQHDLNNTTRLIFESKMQTLLAYMNEDEYDASTLWQLSAEELSFIASVLIDPVCDKYKKEIEENLPKTGYFGDSIEFKIQLAIQGILGKNPS